MDVTFQTRLKSIKAQVREREKDLTERADRRTELKARKEGDTKTLGKLKYPLSRRLVHLLLLVFINI